MPIPTASLLRHAHRSLCAAALCLCGAQAAATAPPTFDTVIGHALLCLDQIDAGYFHAYLSSAFGPSYKHEQGAYWFKAGAILWGVPVSEVMVSDGDTNKTFIAAVFDITAEQLDEAIGITMGIHHNKTDASRFPLREAAAGSVIVYFNKKSKIYCAKSQYLRPLR